MKKDLLLIADNAIFFNGLNSDIGKLAEELKSTMLDHYAAQTEVPKYAYHHVIKKMRTKLTAPAPKGWKKMANDARKGILPSLEIGNNSITK